MDPNLKEWVKRNGRVTKEEERFSVYELNTTTLREDEERKIREVSVGPENDREVKTVLMVGESGAGKTTFLNAFLNVVFGVDMDDDIRLQLKEQSPNCHTAFLFYHQKGMPYPFNYKVVDTLGLGDDDQANVKALKDYLSDQEAISHLNSVALIWKSSSRRLDERSQEILSKVKKLMSSDLQSLTDVLLTFSPHEDSSAVDAIEKTGVAYHKVFHFENAGLYQCPSNEARRRMNTIVWESMVENQEKFIKELNQRQPKSLTNTAKLFAAEVQLEVSQKCLDDIEKQINLKEKDLKDLEDQKFSLEQKEAEIYSKDLQEPTSINEDNDEHCNYCKPGSGDNNNSVSVISYVVYIIHGIIIFLFPVSIPVYTFIYIYRFFWGKNKSRQKCNHSSSMHKTRDVTKEQRDAVLKREQCLELKKEKESLEGEIAQLQMELTKLREEREKEKRILEETRERISKLLTGY